MSNHNDTKALSDLVFTRLDLPEPPQVTIEQVTDWLRSQNRRVMPQTDQHNDARGGGYPWRSVYCLTKGNWDGQFLEAFPEVKAYLDNFPVKGWHSVCMMAQHPGSEVFLHTDPDPALMGWRLYLSHGGPRLYFRKFKERLTERHQTWRDGGPEKLDELCDPEKLYIEDKNERYAWALSPLRAAHGVEKSEVDFGSRIVMLLIPDMSTLDHAAHEELLRRSAEKFKDTAIWF